MNHMSAKPAWAWPAAQWAPRTGPSSAQTGCGGLGFWSDDPGGRGSREAAKVTNRAGKIPAEPPR